MCALGIFISGFLKTQLRENCATYSGSRACVEALMGFFLVESFFLGGGVHFTMRPDSYRKTWTHHRSSLYISTGCPSLTGYSPRLFCLVFKSLHGHIAPQYLHGLLHCRNARPGLCSTGQMLDVPRTATYGGRRFCVFSSRLWNSLPFELKLVTALSSNSFPF